MAQPEHVWHPDRLIKVLEEKYGFSYNDPEDCELEELELEEGHLVFNYNGDFIAECDDEECEEEIEAIYSFIRETGWSLIEHPIDVNAWILFPTAYLDNPITSIFN